VRLFPAIDIQGGRCVRLRRGDFADVTVFGEDPVEVAQYWVSQGARFLHVVDLDGAKDGEPRNLELVRSIAWAVKIPVQYGGGIRTREALELVRDSPIQRLVVGTSALLDAALLQAAVELWGSCLVVAVDAERGWVKTHGWKERSTMRAADFVRFLEEAGVAEILFTDISRDGMMRGVNLEGIKALAEDSALGIIASGGVTDLDDLRTLKTLEPLGVTGVIAGRALYERRFTVAEALEVLGE
jgi:phosphoribosylformimino-5-aminoimidazole carboxamide ribotide isomerase